MSGGTCGKWRWAVVLTSATVMITSLTQAAFVVDESVVEGTMVPVGVSGLTLLILGPAGILMGNGLGPLVWPVIIAAWLFVCWRKLLAATLTGLVAVGLMSIYPEAAGYTAWLANPIIAVTWLLYLRHKRLAALISALMAAGLALSFLLVKEFRKVE
jgi:hypothetical protein